MICCLVPPLNYLFLLWTYMSFWGCTSGSLPWYNRTGGLGIKHQLTYLPLVVFTHLVFTRMPAERYRGQLQSFLLCLCDVFQALISSLICCSFSVSGPPNIPGAVLAWEAVHRSEQRGRCTEHGSETAVPPGPCSSSPPQNTCLWGAPF